METKKKMGRPPAKWMFSFVDFNFENKWTDASEVSEHLDVGKRSVKAFFDKLQVPIKYEVNKGQVRAKFKVAELKKATKDYIKPWQ